MYLLYLDDSGSVSNPADRHIVLAGFAAHERVGHWISKEMDELAEQLWPESPFTLEFRAADIRSGKKHWRGLTRDVRENAMMRILEIVARTSPKVRLFGAAIHRLSCDPDDPMEYAFEQVTSRFDRFLGRLHAAGDTHRGLIILDNSSYETSLQTLAKEFKIYGHRWGLLHNLADVPLFVDSRATRLIQLSDIIAYSLRLYFERGDATYFDVIKHKFDAVGGVIHGLKHAIPAGEQCVCFSCMK